MVHKKLDSDDHYVSQTYLKYFAYENAKYRIPHVFMYRKKEKKNKLVPISSICHRKGGDIINNFTNKFGLREILSRIEPAWDFFIDAVKKQKILNFNQIYSQSEDLPFLYKVSLYFAYLRCLSPTTERLMKEHQEYIYNYGILPLLAESPHIELDEKAHTFIRNGKIHIKDEVQYYKSIGVNLLPEIAKDFYDKDWEVLINISSTPFVTSDTPIILIGEPKLGMVQAPIYLPLTPKYALLMLPTRNRFVRYKETNQQEVQKYNEEIIKWASEMIISSIDDENFSKLVDQYRDYEAKNKIVSINSSNSRKFFSCHTAESK